MSFVVIIPARFQSSRFPGKPLADIAGKSMIQRVHEKSMAAGAANVVVATDDARIEQEVKGFGGQVVMTRPDHESGTERLAEVIETMALPSDTIVVNVQGDEPFIPSENITQVAQNLEENPDTPMATLSVRIKEAEELFNPNAVKVVSDKSGHALYFSRSTIPYDRERFLGKTEIEEFADIYQRHIGIYAYRAGFVQQYIKWQPSPLEQLESLEQLRVLWHGESIHIEEAKVAPPAGIDTPEDLKKALEHFNAISRLLGS
ncbi:MAG: 3-deoxy-manno-octulosonate cytidylyltransferase [Aestuariibacter sp.]